MPLSIWQMCHKRREYSVGMTVVKQPLKVSEIRSLCEAYGAGLDDFEKVLMIEDIVYPMIVEQSNNAGPKDSTKHRRS